MALHTAGSNHFVAGVTQKHPAILRCYCFGKSREFTRKPGKD